MQKTRDSGYARQRQMRRDGAGAGAALELELELALALEQRRAPSSSEKNEKRAGMCGMDHEGTHRKGQQTGAGRQAVKMPAAAKQTRTRRKENRGTRHATTCEADAEGWMKEVG